MRPSRSSSALWRRPMTAAELGSAIGNAVTSRVGDVIRTIDSEPSRSAVGRRVVIGIRTRGEPVWTGPADDVLHSHPVRFVACPSVLSVLDALAEAPPPSDTY